MADTYGSSKYAQSLRSEESFPDPFCDMASTHRPEDLSSVLRWSEFLWNSHGTYREAMERIFSYFLTDVEIIDEEASEDEKDKYTEFLRDDLDIYNILYQVAGDYFCYGNEFTSLLLPFRRSVLCQKCGLDIPIREFMTNGAFESRWENFQFFGNCPKCRTQGAWRHNDARDPAGKPVVKRWSPHEVDIVGDPLRDETAYKWKIPADYRRRITKGELFVLERANWEIVQAVKNGSDLLFDKDVVYHMKDATLCGMNNRGWGISRMLRNFRQAWYVQVLHRYNEALALDYIIPFRVVTPATGAGQTPNDPTFGTNIADFNWEVQRMIRQHRRDPAQWNVLPFPLQYQSLGGDATALAPYQLMDQANAELLDASGCPAELYKANFSAQASPAMLRLFEARHTPLTHNLNGFLGWLIERIAQLFSWEPVKARLMRVTHADDLNRQMAKLQLMMGGQISQTTGLKAVGIDLKEEVRRQLEEEKFRQDETTRMQDQMEGQDEMSQMVQGGGQPGQPADPNAAAGVDPAAAGGQPGAAAQFAATQPSPPNMPTTPQDIMGKAQLIAQDLMGKPETQRKSEIMQLGRSDKVLHSLVLQLMDDMRQQARAQGGQMVLQQQFGKQGSCGGLGSVKRAMARQQREAA